MLKCGVKSQSFGRQNAIPPFDSGMNTFTAIMRDFPSLEAVPDATFGEFQEVRLQQLPDATPREPPQQAPFSSPSRFRPTKLSSDVSDSDTPPIVFSSLRY